MAERLADASRGRFVGRASEIGLFQAALLDAEGPVAVLHFHGPGGIGKSALLRQFLRLAGEAGRPVIRLDGHYIEPSPGGFLRALGEAFAHGAESTSFAGADLPRNCVLLVDTYEVIEALDTWLRESFLPQLPDRSLIVIAGRNPPAPAWRTDTDWAALTRIVEIGNLSTEESAAYLTARGIPSACHTDALRFTAGHPLALALVADAVQRDRTMRFDPQSERDVLRALLDRLVRELPSPARRRALDACALARTTTEDLLAGVAGIEDPRQCFEWLCRQSFVEHGEHGVFPHDLAREALLAELRWRNPTEHRWLIGQIWAHLWRRIARAEGGERQRLQMEALYAIRTRPSNTPYFDWTVTDQVFAEPLSGHDSGAIVEMVRRHEGKASAGIAAHWLRRQPDAFLVFRNRNLERFGFSALLALERAAPEDLHIDPAVRAAAGFIQRHAPLRGGEHAIYLRFWMHRERYQQITAVTNLMAANVVAQCATNSKLAWNFIAMSDPEFWTPHFESVNFPRAPGADFEVGGRRYGVFAHDWRIEPASEWFTHPGRKPMPFAISPAGREAAFSEAEFAAAVRQALRDYTREDLLAANPLLRSGLVSNEAGGPPALFTLKRLIREAVDTLDEHPRDVKFHRAVWRTYIDPAPTQELAAERLGVPFNTYRYQLSRGIERITSYLWRLERRRGSR